MTTNQEAPKFDFSVYWKKTGSPTPLPYKPSDRNFQSINTNKQGYDNNWIFNLNDPSKKIYLIEHFRKEFPPSTDLSEYTLGIQFNNTTGPGLPDEPSWLAVGNQHMQGRILQGIKDYKVEFDLSQLKSALTGTSNESMADQGVRQFTFIPYTKDDTSEPGNLQYFGKRIVSITTGPSDYSYKIPPGNAQAKKYTSEIKYIKDLKDMTNESILPDFRISVGGIADLLLNKGYEDQGGLPENAQQYILNVNGTVDTSVQLLSQAILVKYDGKDPKYINKFKDDKVIMLENNIPWHILGSNDGIIDSRHKMEDGTYPNYEFWNRALELQSSHHTDGYAISVAGVTFKDNAKNGKSAIQLNGYGSSSYDWWVPTDPNKQYDIYWTRIKKAIDNYTENNVKTPARKGDFISPVHMYDNQIFTWADASDGPETLQANSYFQKNVQMTADDNIKVLSQKSTWEDMTLIQGNTGSSINFSGYGSGNGSITGNNLKKY